MEVSGLLVSLQLCVQHAQAYSVREHVSCSVIIPLPQFIPRLRLQRHARRSLCPRRINIQERLRQYTTTCCTVDSLFATAGSGTKKQARFSTFRIYSLLPVSTATTLVPATAFSLLGSAAVSELVSSRHPEGCLKLQIRSCRCSAQSPQRLPRHSEKRSQSYHGPQGCHLLLFPPLAHCARAYHTVGCFPASPSWFSLRAFALAVLPARKTLPLVSARIVHHLVRALKGNVLSWLPQPCLSPLTCSVSLVAAVTSGHALCLLVHRLSSPVDGMFCEGKAENSA